jgi:ferric-chelate reductase
MANRYIILGARVAGDWTQALHDYASTEQGRIAVENDEKVDNIRVPVHVTIDGPFGGCSLNLGEYENVLLAAGGAGVTFILGLLDDLVGRIVRCQRGRGERTRRIEFAWAIRSFGKWFLSPLIKSRFPLFDRVILLSRLYPVGCAHAHGYRGCGGNGRIVT